MMRVKTILALAFLLAMFQGVAQQVKTGASLDSMHILIGDQVKLRIEIEVPESYTVNFPVIAKELTEKIEIVDWGKIDTQKVNQATLYKQEFVVTSFDTGQHIIAPFWFTVKNDIWSDSVPTNPVLLNVYTIPNIDSLMQALKGPIDVKKPYEAPLTLKEVAPWILGGLLLAGLIFLILYAITRKKNNQPIFFIPQKPKEPAHVLALRELNRIKEEKIWQQGKTKLYYSELTDTIRTYIEQRFNVPAMEQTSEETLTEFKSERILSEEKLFNSLEKILRNADLVKFAKYEPLPDENNLALVDAFFFVNQTKIEEKKPTETQVDTSEGDDVEIK
jgi:hypothetical protein